MRVIGVDPGLTTTGYAVVERVAGSLRALDVGTVSTPAGDARAERLATLHAGLCAVVERWGPRAAAIESVFFNANVRTAMATGQASGVALLCLARAGVEVAHYTPTEVKSAVVGVGGASKGQVAAMVAALLRLPAPPRPPDAADACAVAICHLNRSRLAAALRAAR